VWGMDPELQETADSKLKARLKETGTPDPRDRYRQLLRRLKEAGSEGYERAVARFRDDVVGSVARGERDPLEAWFDFGHSLARDLHPGRTVALDATGRSAPYEAPPSSGDLILHLPDEKKEKAVALAIPPEPSPAQQAAMDLLVEGKVRLPKE